MTSTHAAAASMIRAELRKNGIPATVRARIASMMTAVDVTVTDLAPWTVDAIKAYVARFQYGHFDGMTDCYEYTNRRDDLPQVKYASVNVEYSDAMHQRAWEYLRGYMVGYESAPEAYKDAYNFKAERCNDYAPTMVYRVLNGSLGNFWPKPRVRAAA